MHPDADAFLDAIFDAPHDDLPRLAYADWLEEHGQANYAQFIRLQCAAARERPFSPAANDLWERIGRVWNGMRAEFWLDDGDDWGGPSGIAYGNIDATWFHRGFLREEIATPYEVLTRHAARRWPWFPTPVCRLAADWQWAGEAAEIRGLRRVRRLVLEGGSDSEWAVFLSSPNLSRVESLHFARGILSAGELNELLRPGILPGVRELKADIYDYEARGRVGFHDVSHDLTRAGIRARLEARFREVRINWEL